MAEQKMRNDLGLNAVATLALAIASWRGYVAVAGTSVQRAYNFGGSPAKWFAASFGEAFVICILAPMVVTFPVAFLLTRRASCSYRVALAVAALWTVVGLVGLSRAS